MSRRTSSFASSGAVRQRMQAVRRRDTGPELALRKALWRSGLRYRVDARPLATVRRRADIVFTRKRVAVFVDGCFWHGCPEHGCVPKTNQWFWLAKIQRTIQRDLETTSLLKEAGWSVVRVWEHESTAEAASRVHMALY